MGHEFAGEVGTIFEYEGEATVPDGRLGVHRNLGRQDRADLPQLSDLPPRFQPLHDLVNLVRSKASAGGLS